MNGDKKPRKVVVGGGRSVSSNSSSGSAMFPFFTTMYQSKAEQILSRYRPIAPKPPAPSAGKAEESTATPAAGTGVQSSSSISIGCRKGSRKRSAGDSLPSPRGSKRSVSIHNRKTQELCQKTIHPVPQHHQQMVPVMVGNELHSMSTGTTSVSVTDAVPSESGVWKVLGSPNPKSPNLLLEDAGSNALGWKSGYEILKASHNSRSFSISDLGSAGGGFLYPSNGNSNVHLSVSPTPLSAVAHQNGRLGLAQNHHGHFLPGVQPEEQTEAAEGEGEDDRPKLVTLSLLPDTPAQVSESSACDFTNRLRLDVREESSQQPLELSLFSGSTTSGTPRYTAVEPQRYVSDGRRPEQRASALTSAVIDSSYLEQAYGGSSDPVVLTEGNSSNSAVLWSNLSYNKVMTDRLSGKSQRAAGPYIDPLGLPTQLGCFRYRSRGGVECNAVLWGFLKKFMLLDNLNGAAPPRAGAGAVGGGGGGGGGNAGGHGGGEGSVNYSVNSGEVVEQISNSVHHQRNVDSGHVHHRQHQSLNLDYPQQQELPQQHQQQQRMIAPQLVRPMRMIVGSSVCLDSVSEVDSYSGYLTGSLESVEAQLERSGVPAFVTDRSNRVRWVNSAYNQLVCSPPLSNQHQHQHQQQQQHQHIHQQHQHQHQQQQQQQQQQSMSSRLESVNSTNSSGSVQGDRKPEVCFMSQCDRNPYSSVRLAGQVRVDWVDCGKRCCLTGVPCEMRRLDDPHFGSVFVWKLNLNVGTVRSSYSGNVNR